MKPRKQSDAECMYCPRCGDEYRLGIKNCAECKIALVSGKELNSQEQGMQQTEPIQPGEELVAVQAGTILQMRQLQEFLTRAGLASLVTPGADGHCHSGCKGPEVELQVRKGDYQAVLQTLAEEHRQATRLDAHEVQPGSGTVYDTELEQASCPACGCLFSTKSTLCPDCGLRFV